MKREHFDGQGFSFLGEGKSLRVGNLPGRKKVCVYEITQEKENSVDVNVLAYCANKESATKMLDWLNRLYEE